MLSASRLWAGFSLVRPLSRHYKFGVTIPATRLFSQTHSVNMIQTRLTELLGIDVYALSNHLVLVAQLNETL
jgi:hypothetical protein